MIARPSTIYRLVVIPFRMENKQQEVDLRASMSSSQGSEVAFAVGKGFKGLSTELMMKVKESIEK